MWVGLHSDDIKAYNLQKYEVRFESTNLKTCEDLLKEEAVLSEKNGANYLGRRGCRLLYHVLIFTMGGEKRKICLQHDEIDKQIEQSTPSVGKQSTVATSTMKRTKQTNLDNDGNNSAPSKKSKDETLLEDSSKIINDTSAGLDSEFGKTENLSHGKKVVSWFPYKIICF
ncbi:hypothetical protein Tco_1459684 [Tanacetum coccineum]